METQHFFSPVGNYEFHHFFNMGYKGSFTIFYRVATTARENLMGTFMANQSAIFFPSDFKGKVVDIQYGRHHVLALTSSGKAGCDLRRATRLAGGFK